MRISRGATYLAVALSMPSIFACSGSDKSYEVERVHEGVGGVLNGDPGHAPSATQEYCFRAQKGDNPWILARMAYGTGTRNKEIIELSYDDAGFNPNKDVYPNDCINVDLTQEQVNQFRTKYPKRNLKEGYDCDEHSYSSDVDIGG